MKKSDKIMFKGAGKSLRRMLTQLANPSSEDRKVKPFMMTNDISRPKFVTRTDGKHVAYEGP